MPTQFRKRFSSFGVFIAIFLLVALAFNFGSVSAQNAPLPNQIQNQGNNDLAVTPIGYDDIGAVLQRLGFGSDLIAEENLSDLSQLQSYDSVFLNCSGSIEQHVNDETVAAIREYVRGGGVIYASDYAAPLIDKAFPGKIIFYDDPAYEYDDYDYDFAEDDEYTFEYYEYKVGEAGLYQARIVDQGLAAVLGKNEIEVNFDLASWVVMIGVGEGTTVHVRGPANVFAYNFDSSQDNLDDVPYVVSFTEGDGEVIYTSFHNEAQNTADMEKVLDWFAVRTRGGQLVQTNRELATQNGGMLSEIVDDLNEGESKSYEIAATGASDFAVIVNFIGSKMGFVIVDPAGNKVVDTGVDEPPFAQTVAAVEGVYTVTVIGKNIPEDNSPFVLTFAGSEGAIEQVSAGEAIQSNGFDVMQIVKVVVIVVVVGGVLFVIVRVFKGRR